MIRRPPHRRLRSGALTLTLAVTLLCPAGAHAAGLLSAPASLTLPTTTAGLTFSSNGSYLIASSPSLLSVYALSAVGGPRRIGTPIAAPNNPGALTFDPTGHFLATANAGDKTVSLYSLSPTGRLTPANYPAPAHDGAGMLAFSRDGKLLAATLPAEHAVLLYSVSSSGTLTPLGPPLQTGFSNGVGGMDVTFSRTTDVLAVLDGGDVVTFAVSGASEPDAPAAAVMAPGASSLSFSRDGHHLTATGSGTPALTTFEVAADGGIAGPPVTAPEPRGPAMGAYSPHGDTFATLNIDWTLTTRRPTASGALEEVDTQPVQSYVPYESGFVFSPDGAWIVAFHYLSLSFFAVSPGGRLTQVGMTRSTEGRPGRVETGVGGGNLVVVGGEKLSVFGLYGGSLQRLATGLGPITLGGNAENVAVQPNQHTIALVRLQGQLETYAVADDGTLQIIESTTVPTAQSPSSLVGLAFAPDGGHLAVVDASDSTTASYAVSPTGQTTLVGKAPVYGWINYSPDGSHLAVSNGGAITMLPLAADGTVQSSTEHAVFGYFGYGPPAFDRDGGLMAALGNYSVGLFSVAADGALTHIGSEPLIEGPAMAAAFSPDGSLLAVANGYGDNVALFAVSAAGLTAVGTPTPVGSYPSGVAFDPTGQFLVVSSMLDETLTVLPLAAQRLDPIITAGPPAATNGTSAQLQLDATYAATYTCALDGHPATACDAEVDLGGLAEGTHQIEVRARDALGNAGRSVATRSWTVDSTPPAAIPDLVPADGERALPSATTLTWSTTSDAATTIDHYALDVDDQPRRTIDPGSCAPRCGVSLDHLADGAHRWTVGAYDMAGNVRWSPMRTFSVDDAPPEEPALRAPADGALLAAVRPELTWDATNDAGTGVKAYDVVVDDSTVATLDGTTTRYAPTADLGQGAHRWRIVARDGYGHERSSVTRGLTVDSVPPTPVLRASPSRFIVPYTVTLDASGSSDPGGRIDHYEFDLDGDGRYETASAFPRAQTTLGTVGDHRLGVRVVDEVGLAAVAEEHVTGEIVDTPRSKEAFVTVDGGAEYTRKLAVTLTINPPPHSGATTMIVSNDGRPDQTLRRDIATTVPWALARGDGLRDRRIVYVVFYNAAGVQVTNGRVSDDILFDPYPPAVAKATITRTGARSARLTVAAKDRGSGLARLELRAGKRVVARRSRVSRTQSLKVRGTLRHLTLAVYDKAGNSARVPVRARAAPPVLAAQAGRR